MEFKLNNGLLNFLIVVVLFCCQLYQCQPCKLINNEGMSMTGYCNGTSMVDIPPDKRGSLQILRVENTKIKTLEDSTFKEFPRVKRLYLCHNSIAEIEQKAFKPLKDLEVLNLSSNVITNLGFTTFIHNTKLTDLDLSSNRFLHVPADKPFLIIPSLITLRLSHCGITGLSESTFTELSDLQTIDLRGNAIFAKSFDQSLNSLPELKSLYVSDGVPLCDETYGDVMEMYRSVIHNVNSSDKCYLDEGNFDLQISETLLLCALVSLCGVLLFILLVVLQRKCRSPQSTEDTFTSRLQQGRFRRKPQRLISVSLSTTTATTNIEDPEDGYEVPILPSQRHAEQVERLPPAPPMYPTEFVPTNPMQYMPVLPCRICHEDLLHKIRGDCQSSIDEYYADDGYEQPMKYKCKCSQYGCN